MAEAVIVAGARTPIGKLSGALGRFHRHGAGRLRHRRGPDAGRASPPTRSTTCSWARSSRPGRGRSPARQAAVKAGIPMTVPANTINKVCLSGLNTIYLADQMIRAGDADIVVAGGMESMTQAPYLLPGARAGYRIGDGALVDSMMYDGLTDAFDHIAMGLSTERYNEKAKISRERQDAFAAASHEKAAAAAKDGRLAEEIVPVQVPQRKGDPLLVDVDEGVRPGTTAESLGALQAGLRQERHHHRRQRLADLRRRRGGHRDVGGQGQGARPHPAGPDRQLRPGGRARHLAADPALAGHRQGGQEGRHRARRHRPLRDQRGLRRRRPGLGRRPGHRRGARSTSTAAPSRSGTRSACRAPGWRSPPCSSCAAAGPAWPPWRSAVAAGRATPPSCASSAEALEADAGRSGHLVERRGEQLDRARRALALARRPSGRPRAGRSPARRWGSPGGRPGRGPSCRRPSSPRASAWAVGLWPDHHDRGARRHRACAGGRSTSSGSAP